jgi:hypothetical protein
VGRFLIVDGSRPSLSLKKSVTEVLLYDWHSEGAERCKLEFGMDSRRNNNLRHHTRKSTYVHVTTCISNAVDMVVVSGTGKRIDDSLTTINISFYAI